MKSILMLHWLGKLLHTTAYKESPLVRLITCSDQQVQGKTLHCVVHAAPPVTDYVTTAALYLLSRQLLTTKRL